jgi:hypothetical protein
MTGPTVKIIKGAGPTLSLAQLERASAKLLISRIRGHEPQVSFTFVQRLLDELIRRRRDEEELQCEADFIAEDLEKLGHGASNRRDPEQIESAQYETLMSADVEVLESIDETTSGELEIPEEIVLDEDSPLYDMAEPAQEDEEDPEEEVEQTSPSRKRGRVAACSRPRHGALDGDINTWRIVVIALIAVFVMIVGVIAMGCGTTLLEGGR